MPVRHASEDDPIGPYRRLSHTQSAMLANCPRQWYHRYRQGLRGESPPILAMGRAVEEAICRTLRESPVLTPVDAQSEWMDSPLDSIEDVNRPSRGLEGWRGPAIETLSKSRWPLTEMEILDWAMQRLDLHFTRAWDKAAREWAEDPNRSGNWSEFTESDGPRAHQMARNAIGMHMEEVSRCITEYPPERLAEWRAGSSRPTWPAPDGFPYEWSQPHPAAKEGGVMSLMEAWEIARPWFVDPDADSFSLSCIHRDHWFQGEYDLIYRWDGIRIIDIKASAGASDRSGDYIKQMQTYAWLWWDMHGNTPPDGLEIWYLGADSRKSVEVPEDLRTIGEQLYEQWQRMQEEDAIIDDFEMQPAPYRQFSAGGISDGEDLSALTRCTHCDFVSVCPNSGPIQLPSAGTGYTAIEDVDPYLTAWGRAYRLSEELQFPFSAGIRKREFTLHMEDGQVNCVLDDDIVLPEWEEGMSVRIFQATPAIVKKGTQWWKRLKLGRGASVVLAGDRRDGDCLMSQVDPMEVSVTAKVFSFDHRSNQRPDGTTSNKWAARLVDDSGVIPVEGWDDKVISMLIDGDVSRGDLVEAIGFSVVGNAAGRPVLRAKKNRSGSSRLRRMDSSS